MPCKGICCEFEVKKINPKDSGMYDLGYKRCAECETFMKCDEIRCPCCKTLLRNKPRQARLRQRFVEK